MPGFWSRFQRQPQAYELARLVDTRQISGQGEGGLQIICDIDKTYLETEFESVLRMARIALEDAADKITVAGATEVLLAARWGDQGQPSPEKLPRPLHFISSSPPQLRAVLAEKLAMDGLDWSSDTFKNQAYNLRMRRMDLLKQHVAYKSYALLQVAWSAQADARFLCIGDNAESDGYIYVGIKLLLAGRLSSRGLAQYLEIAGVEPGMALGIEKQGLPKGPKLHAILIRNVPRYKEVHLPPLTSLIQPFDNFFQAALLLALHGYISSEQIWPLARNFHNHHGMSRKSLRSSLKALELAEKAPYALRSAALAAQVRLGTEGDVQPSKVLSASIALGLSEPPELNEGEILDAAKGWIDLLSQRQRRKDI